MKTQLQIALAVAFALTPQIASADEACKAEFRDYLRHKHEGYPHAVSSLSIYDGTETKGRGIALTADHSINFNDVSGTWTVTKGLGLYLSSDKGKTWRKLATMPKDTYTRFSSMYEQQATAATKITCEDNVRYQGKSYRLLQGQYNAATGGTVIVHQKFYTNSPRGTGSNWSIRISESKIGEKTNMLIETVTARGDELAIPKIDLGK